MQTDQLTWSLGIRTVVTDTTDSREFIIFGEHAENILQHSEQDIRALEGSAQYAALVQVCETMCEGDSLCIKSPIQVAPCEMLPTLRILHA